MAAARCRAYHVRLGLSIHTAIAAQRRALMPIARAHALDDVLAACADHARITGHAPIATKPMPAGRLTTPSNPISR